MIKDIGLNASLSDLGVKEADLDAIASGVDMGRNIFQAEAPVPMIKSVKAIVHKGLNPEQAFEMYNDLKK